MTGGSARQLHFATLLGHVLGCFDDGVNTFLTKPLQLHRSSYGRIVFSMRFSQRGNLRSEAKDVAKPSAIHQFHSVA